MKKYILVTLLVALVFLALTTLQAKNQGQTASYQDNILSFQYPKDYKVEISKPSDQLGDCKWGQTFFSAKKEPFLGIFGEDKKIQMIRLDYSSENFKNIQEAILSNYQSHNQVSELMTMNISNRPIIYYKSVWPAKEGGYREAWYVFIPINETTFYMIEYTEKVNNYNLSATNLPKDLNMILNTLTVKTAAPEIGSTESTSSGSTSGAHMLTPEDILEIMKPYASADTILDVYLGEDGYYHVTAYDAKHPEYGAIGGATVDPYTGKIISALG